MEPKEKEGINETSFKVLSGGGEFNEKQQRIITEELGKFLTDSGRMIGMGAT